MFLADSLSCGQGFNSWPPENGPEKKGASWGSWGNCGIVGMVGIVGMAGRFLRLAEILNKLNRFCSSAAVSTFRN